MSASHVSYWFPGNAKNPEGRLDMEKTGLLNVIAPLPSVTGKDIVVECSGEFSPMMRVMALTFGTTPESASIAGNLAVAPTDQKKKIRFLLDPSGSGTAVELLLQLNDQGQDNTWSIKSCTVEPK